MIVTSPPSSRRYALTMLRSPMRWMPSAIFIEITPTVAQASTECSPAHHLVEGRVTSALNRRCGFPKPKEVQNVLRARGRLQSQEPMVGVCERPPAANGDEPGVTVLGQDHPSILSPAQASVASATTSSSDIRRPCSQRRP